MEAEASSLFLASLLCYLEISGFELGSGFPFPMQFIKTHLSLSFPAYHVLPLDKRLWAGCQCVSLNMLLHTACERMCTRIFVTFAGLSLSFFTYFFTVTNPIVQQKFHLPMSLPDACLHDVLSDVSYVGSCDLQVLIL